MFPFELFIWAIIGLLAIRALVDFVESLLPDHCITGGA